MVSKKASELTVKEKKTGFKLKTKSPQEKKFTRKAITPLVISAIACLLLIRVDLATKEVIFKYLPISESGQRMEGFVRATIFPGFALVNVQNTGVAWGKLQGLGNSTQVLTVIGLVLELALLMAFFMVKSNLQKVSIVLIFSGGFGNIYDRVKVGYVRDFIDLYIGEYHWPAFNMADTFVAIGACILIASDIATMAKLRKTTGHARKEE